MENNIIKVRSAQDIIISSIFIIGGIACILSGHTSLAIFGAFITILGAILALVLKSGYRIDGELYKRVTFNCDRSSKDAISAFLKGSSKDFKPEEGNGSLLLYVYLNRKGERGYAISYEFSNYEYLPCTELLPLNAPQVRTVSSFKR